MRDISIQPHNYALVLKIKDLFAFDDPSVYSFVELSVKHLYIIQKHGWVAYKNQTHFQMEIKIKCYMKHLHNSKSK